MKSRGHNTRFTRWSVLLVISLVACLLAASAEAAPTLANITGEIERIELDPPGTDHWSGGKIVVGGQWVILPRNLLIDLPANRLTLKQLFEQAPAACVANGESGLAKADACNLSGTGGFATISANRSNFGNVIAGDVLIEKGKESVTGVVTFIDYTDGYFRVSGQPALDNAGVIVRINDPTGRHTVQGGLGCAAGSTAVNCSPDPRFTLDPDNYTNVFTTGFPLCLPSTLSRPFPGLPAVTGVPALAAGSAQSNAAGDNDLLCPSTNRGPAGVVPEPPVADSRRFSPIKVGDSVTAEGNFETIAGVTFLSSHTTKVLRALQTRDDPSQPDYLFLEEVFIDAPGFINQRARMLIIGFTTLATGPGTDVLFWTLHRDPLNNAIHEFPLASTIGCDIAAGSGSCTSQGLVGAGGNIFRIRYDVDFLLAALGGAGGGGGGGVPGSGYGSAKPKLSPCAQLRAEPRFGVPNICPSATAAVAGNPLDGTGHLRDEWSIMSPIPREIQARTGHRLANPGLVTLDVNGIPATNGQYLFPFGINLGGISLQEFVEVNLDLMNTPSEFSGIPWNLDRRLSPGGCNGPCETDAIDNTYKYRLDPFPFENMDPRTQADFLAGFPIPGPGGLPISPPPYTDNVYTASALTNVRNRIFSYVDPVLGKFNGDSTVIPFNFIPVVSIPPILPPGGPPGVGGVTTLLTPPAFPILETPPLPLPPPVAANAVTLTASPVDNGAIVVGTTVVFTAAASGGSGTYEYEFLARFATTGGFSIFQGYSTTNTWTWNSAGFPPTIYEIAVYARSVGSTAAVEAVATLVYTLTVPPTTSVGLTAAPVSPVSVGSSVLFTATPTVGGTATHQYQFWYRSVGAPTFSMAQDYGAANTFNWGATAGSYEWKVFARSTGSTAASEAVSPSIVPFVVAIPTPPAPPAASSVALTSSPVGGAAPGDNVTYTAVASPVPGTYEYEFWLYNYATTGPWTVVQPYSTLSTWAWNTNVPSGPYGVAVYARTLGSIATFEAIDSQVYNLNRLPVDNVTLTPSAPTPHPYGTSVTFTASATGGTGIYEYEWWFYAYATEGPWGIVQPYGAFSNSSWTTSALLVPGSYNVAVYARSAGSTATFEQVANMIYIVVP